MNGLLLIDKSPGMTSHDVVARVRRIVGLRGVGHAGTLDPIASGLLVLLLGEATKISDYILNGDKRYEVQVRLGQTTDTLDREGEILTTAPVQASAETLRETALALNGVIDLEVPVYSAVKVQGQKLYDYARRDKDVQIPTRAMHFYDVEVVAQTEDTLTARMRCSKGTFVRSWAQELGRRLGCGGMVQELRRLDSFPYSVKAALTLEQLEAKWQVHQEAGGRREGEVLGEAWISLKDTLPQFRSLFVSGQDERLMRHGQISNGLQGQLLSFIVPGEQTPSVKVISRTTSDLVSLLVPEPGQFYRIRRVFQR